MQCKKINLFLLASIVNALFTGVQGVSLNKISKEKFLDNNIFVYHNFFLRTFQGNL